MVCHSLEMVGKEKIVGMSIWNFLILISVGFGVASLFYSDSTFIFLLCMGKEERFYLEISGKQPGVGTEIRLEIFNPFRLAINIVGALFIFVVPILYYRIFKFRKKQDISIKGV